MPVNSNMILFGSSYSVIEPLGILHLGGLARDLGYERGYCLIRNHDYSEFHQKIKKFQPKFAAFNIYTGNHLQLYDYLKLLKKEFPEIITILGGPHPSYFPHESSKHADLVVISEGFVGLKDILEGKIKKGVILPSGIPFTFPFPDRKKFYETYADHKNSPIKSIITTTGCPFRCTYCYNSSNIEDISSGLPSDLKKHLVSNKLGGRLFTWNSRTVTDVIKEAKEISLEYPTKMIYFQDDVFGMKLDWLEEFSERFPKEVGIRWHAQMRWEMTHSDAGKKRLDLCKKGGCCGLTLAIEAADPIIRTEVLDRKMTNEIIFEGLQNCMDRGFKVRTEQITGLPYGATSVKTKINLEADLEILELNVKLREKTGGPHVSWASTLVPYIRTKLGKYCADYGFHEYENNENIDIKDTFFEKSILRFLKKYVGPSLLENKDDSSLWLSEEELELYRNQNAEFRRHFNIFAYMKNGHVFAKNYILKGEYTFENIGKMIREWNKTPVSEETALIENSNKFIKDDNQKKTLKFLAPYFLVLPSSLAFCERFFDNAEKKGYSMKTLSETTRHHLYEYVLYYVKS